MLKFASTFRLTWPKTREMLNVLNMINVFRAMSLYGPISGETFNMFSMFNISRILSHVKDFWTATFNISCVLSDFRLTRLTFPAF